MNTQFIEKQIIVTIKPQEAGCAIEAGGMQIIFGGSTKNEETL